MNDNERRALARAAGGPRPVGAFAARLLDPVARARGFATTTLLSEWGAIVGAELARFTMPDRVVWPRRQDGEGTGIPTGWRPDGATLILRVEGPRAIEVQHRADKIIERVNTYFGYRAVTGIRILQAPVGKAEPRPAPPQPPDSADVPPSVAAIAHEGLRRALSRLGALTRSKITRG